MSYLVLARKYRPQTFESVVGQEHVTRTLTNAITMDRVPHAVLFTGPRGTGKTTAARVLAKAMNCEKGPTKTPCNKCGSCKEITGGGAADVFEIDGASNNSVDQIRELRENVKYMPSHSRYKIYIIDEVHMLSIAAFNALLKTLEEPPSHIMFIFATTEPHKIPLTILSRCQRHDFKRIGLELIFDHLKALCQKEGFVVDDESIVTIAREAGGSMRDALSLLDQVMACADGDMSHDQLMDMLGVIDRKQIHNISKAVFNSDIPKLLEILDHIYNRGHDVKKLYSDLIEHFRNMMVIKMGSRSEKLLDLPKDDIDNLKEQVAKVPLTYLNQIMNFLFDVEGTIRNSEQPKLSLELAFIKFLHVKPVLPIDVLIEKLNHLRTEFKEGAKDRIKDTVSPYDNPDEHPAGYPPNKRIEAQTEIKATKTFDQMDSKSREPLMEIENPVADLDGLWKKLLDRISKESPSVAANLIHSSLKSIKGKDVEIEINGSEFNINMVKREKNLKVLQALCDDVFGKKTNLIIHAKKKTHDLRAQKENRENLKQEALNHPLISDAMNIFNGKIIDIKLL